jgi:hypothetical protein
MTNRGVSEMPQRIVDIGIIRGVKCSSFGLENIPGFIPVYSGILFRIFRNFAMLNQMDPSPIYENHVQKCANKCAKMA